MTLTAGGTRDPAVPKQKCTSRMAVSAWRHTGAKFFFRSVGQASVRLCGQISEKQGLSILFFVVVPFLREEARFLRKRFNQRSPRLPTTPAARKSRAGRAAWPRRKTEFAISLKECMFQSTVAPSTEGVIKKDFIGFAVLSSSLVPLKREVSNHNGIFDERAETHP